MNNLLLKMITYIIKKEETYFKKDNFDTIFSCILFFRHLILLFLSVFFMFLFFISQDYLPRIIELILFLFIICFKSFTMYIIFSFNPNEKLFEKEDAEKKVLFFSTLESKKLRYNYMNNILSYTFYNGFLKDYEKRFNLTRTKAAEQSFFTSDLNRFHHLENALNVVGYSLRNGKIQDINAIEQLKIIRKEKSKLALKEKELVSYLYSRNQDENIKKTYESNYYINEEKIKIENS